MVGKGQQCSESVSEECERPRDAENVPACHVSTLDSISRVSVPESASHVSEGVVQDG